jgi:hypothetical protein
MEVNMKRQIVPIMVVLTVLSGCSTRSIEYIENFDYSDIHTFQDAGINPSDAIIEDITDVSDTAEVPLRLIFEADKDKPQYQEVALVPAYSDDKILVVDMLLGGDDNQKLTFYGAYYRVRFPEDVLEVETIASHPELPPGIINKFTVRKGEIIGVITNKGDTPMMSLSCKRPLISMRFRIKMIKTGTITIVDGKTKILDDKLRQVVNNYYSGKLTIVQK